MEVINKHRKKLIILGVIIEIILVPLIVRNIISLNNKGVNDNIPVMNEVGKQEFGIMYRDNDTDSYKAYSGSIVDAVNNSYELNLTNSKCSDESGATITPGSVLSINGSTVTVKSNKTLYCTLYFDYNKTIRILRENDPNNTLSKDIVGDMYRYQAAIAFSDVNDPQKVNEFVAEMPNHICFGTTENCGASDELIDKYMYRIIGVAKDGRLKLIKETYINEDDNYGDNKYTIFNWHSRIILLNDYYKNERELMVMCNDGTCSWSNSLLFKRLNGNQNGTVKGAGEFTATGDTGYTGDTDIFVDNPNYEYLKSGDGKNGGSSASTWYNLIEDHEWLYGDIGGSKFHEYVDQLDGDTLYAIETGQKEVTHYTGTFFSTMDGNASRHDVYEETYKWTKKVTAKIGLLYLHDFFYTFPKNSPWGDVVTIQNYGYVDQISPPKNFSWLFTLLPKALSDASSLSFIDRGGLLGITNINDVVFLTFYVELTQFYAERFDRTIFTRPVFYLNSSVKLSGTGNGTKTNPFILNVS